jgi:DNA-binding PadR family transcriptional regulator
MVDISMIDYYMPKQKLSPLPSAAFQILLALVGKDLHGYGIMRNVAEQTEGRMRLGPGTLYSSIQTLLEEELIEEIDYPRDPNVKDERRRYYRLTSAGRKLARSEAERLADLLRVARAKNILRGDYV